MVFTVNPYWIIVQKPTSVRFYIRATLHCSETALGTDSNAILTVLYAQTVTNKGKNFQLDIV